MNSLGYSFKSLIKVFWLFVTVLIIATALFTVWFSYSAYQAQSNAILSSLEGEALKLSKTWSDDIDYVAYQMEVLGKQIKQAPRDLQNIHTILAYSKIEHRVNNSITWNMFSWADANNQILVDAELGVLKEPKDISMRDYIPVTKEFPWKIHLGRPVHGAVSNQWLIPAGMGYSDAKGNYLGAVVFGFEIPSLVTKLERIVNTPGVSFFIFDANGNFIVSSRNAKPGMQEWLLSKLGPTSLPSNNSVISTQSLLDNTTPYAYRTMLSNKGFSIVTLYDNTLASEAFIKGLAARVIELIVVLSVLLLFLGIFWQQFIKPVLALSEAATSISKGEIEVRVPRPSIQELHILAKQLVQIIRYIKRNNRIQKELTYQSKELVAAYAIAEEANQMKRRFLANMSHELRTPLNAISGFSEIITLELYGSLPKKYAEAGKAIHTASNHLLKLINELLDFSKIEAGKMQLYEAHCSVEELFESCQLYIAPMAEQKRIHFSILYPKKPTTLYCDEFRLKQALLNLLSNALKFTEPGGEIMLSGDVGRDGLTITVQDTGGGIAEEDIPNVLSEFGQVRHENRHINEGGTGLGLPIAKRLVEMHQGTLTLSSRIGEGTTITLYFSLERIKNREI